MNAVKRDTMILNLSSTKNFWQIKNNNKKKTHKRMMVILNSQYCVCVCVGGSAYEWTRMLII